MPTRSRPAVLHIPYVVAPLAKCVHLWESNDAYSLNVVRVHASSHLAPQQAALSAGTLQRSHSGSAPAAPGGAQSPDAAGQLSYSSSLDGSRLAPSGARSCASASSKTEGPLADRRSADNLPTNRFTAIYHQVVAPGALS